MSAVFRKELKLLTHSPYGYVFAAILLLCAGVSVTWMHLLVGGANFGMTLSAMHLPLAILIPFLTVQTVTGERTHRTELLLFSLPIRTRDIVLGKFFALTVFFFVPTAILSLYPLLLSSMGAIDLAAAYSAIVGFALLGMSLIALCMFLCTLAPNRPLAVLISAGTLLLLCFLYYPVSVLPVSAAFSFAVCLVAALSVSLLLWRATRKLIVGGAVALLTLLLTVLTFVADRTLFEGLVPRFLHGINVFFRFSAFTYGTFDLSCTVFYLSFAACFLFLTVQAVELRRRT